MGVPRFFCRHCASAGTYVFMFPFFVLSALSLLLYRAHCCVVSTRFSYFTEFSSTRGAVIGPKMKLYPLPLYSWCLFSPHSAIH